MELENELFLATIEWTWECCLKQKESDNEKSVALCKAYKGGQFGLLQVDQTEKQGKIEYRKLSLTGMTTSFILDAVYSACFKDINTG